jgi:murein L,D-transpeptidase YafK
MDNDYPVMAWGWTIGRGSSALFRASLVRALTASAVLAGALTLAGCYGDDGYQLPTRAMKELSPEMLTLLDQKNMPKESPILIRIFKEESELEVWKQDTTARYELVKVYPICRWSGGLGPKVKEGDRQAPEGFYPISPGLMNPNSSYYLAINIGFPNAFDKANGYSGAFLMIHGDCSSRGCYAMTDEQIGEIYSLAREAFLGGQKAFQVQAYPFRMTPANLARHRDNPNMAYWKMIKVGNDHFEVSHQEPKIDVCEKHYVFDAVPPAGSTKPLAFTPSGRCPVYETDPNVAEQAMAKQKNDDYQFAQMQNVATVPIETGTDGGMNRVFMSKLENPTYTYDNEGHLHVPPLQPGRLPPQISTKESSYAAASNPSSSGVSGFFGSLFNKNSASPKVAAADTSSTGSTGAASAPTHTGFFSSLFSSSHDAAPQANAPADAEQTASATAPPAKPSKPAASRPRINTDSQKSEPQVADTTKPKTAAPTSAPQKEANSAAPPPSNNGMLNGAQPVVPAGTFSNRFGF